jgi:hypothetical protein
MASAWVERRSTGSFIVVWREPDTGTRRSKGGFRLKGEAEAFRDELKAKMNTGLYLPEAMRNVPRAPTQDSQPVCISPLQLSDPFPPSRWSTPAPLTRLSAPSFP